MRGSATALATALVFVAASTAAGAERILVFAAASLILPLTEIARAYEVKTGHRVRISFAASSALARQIDAGAPADLYLSANLQWMNWLEARGKIDKASKSDLAGNRLVLVAPAGSLPAMDRFSGPTVIRILKGHRLAIADPAHVPAGMYAKQALTKFASWPRISAHLAPTVNVRAALALVERRAVPLGIVYASDAFNNRAVDVLYRFASNSHAPIRYVAAAVIGNGGSAAIGFLIELTGRKSKRTFKKFDFSAD